MALGLGLEEWVHVISKLSYRDTLALGAASATLGRTLEKAQALWADQALSRASLVTVVHWDGGRAVVVTRPAGKDYRLEVQTTPAGTGVSCVVPRRLLALEFPRFCMSALGGRSLARTESFLSFTNGVASSLPLGPLAPYGDHTAWLQSRLATDARPYPPAEWPGVLGMHVRFYIGIRTGGPKRQRGHRTRRWTKSQAGAAGSADG